MPNPNCPKCKHENFELVQVTARNANNDIAALCCEKCGSIIGVIPRLDAGEILHVMARKLKISLDD